MPLRMREESSSESGLDSPYLGTVEPVARFRRRRGKVQEVGEAITILSDSKNKTCCDTGQDWREENMITDNFDTGPILRHSASGPGLLFAWCIAQHLTLKPICVFEFKVFRY
jgi:hypothetical protein